MYRPASSGSCSLWEFLQQQGPMRCSRGLRSCQGVLVTLAKEEGSQALAGAELAGCKGALLLLGKHSKLAGAHIELLVVL